MQIKAKGPSYDWRQGRWWTKEMQIRKEIHSPSPSYSLRHVDRKSQEALTALKCSHKKAFEAQERTNTTPLSRELTSYPINVCWLEFRRVPASSGDHIDCWPNLGDRVSLWNRGSKYEWNIPVKWEAEIIRPQASVPQPWMRSWAMASWCSHKRAFDTQVWFKTTPWNCRKSLPNDDEWPQNREYRQWQSRRLGLFPAFTERASLREQGQVGQ